MFKTPRNRRGFTITEVLVAVLLVLILSAIAVPRLLGNQRQADDTAAKGQLRTAAEAARNLMYEAGNKFDTTQAGAGATTRLTKDEPNIQFVDGATNSSVVDRRRTVSVYVPAGGTQWVAAVKGGKEGSNENCWFIRLNTAGADEFGLRKSSATCNASDSSGVTFQGYDFPAL